EVRLTMLRPSAAPSRAACLDHLTVAAALVVSSHVFLAVPGFAQNSAGAPVKRARPPEFDAAKSAEYFFDDVFSKLIGPRPTAAASAAPGPAATGSVATPAGTAAPAGAPAALGAGWSKLVSASTLEDEVKAIKQEVDKNITTPSDFAGRGHKVIRREFSMLAMLFGIIAEYDGDVRFKRDAGAARALFGRTASNTKAGGNTNVFNEAKLRKADLEDLLNGSSLADAGNAGAADWSSTVDRSPLMQRLEASFQNRLSPALASQDEFTKTASTVLHESELIAAMSSVLIQEGMDDADDETYAGFARAMRDAASEISAAVKQKNYDQARAASGLIDKACSQCHEAYR
ncbi:MAG: hypothetical protein AB7O38_22435, partial [Pirellulaceae bacterium]